MTVQENLKIYMILFSSVAYVIHNKSFVSRRSIDFLETTCCIAYTTCCYPMTRFSLFLTVGSARFFGITVFCVFQVTFLLHVSPAFQIENDYQNHNTKPKVTHCWRQSHSTPSPFTSLNVSQGCKNIQTGIECPLKRRAPYVYTGSTYVLSLLLLTHMQPLAVSSLYYLRGREESQSRLVWQLDAFVVAVVFLL